MTIGLPGGVRLRLGDDLTAGFPGSLTQITNSDLLALLKQIDPTPDSLNETGAIDWADLPDRIHFHCRYVPLLSRVPATFESPFTSLQVTDIRAGRLPAGEL